MNLFGARQQCRVYRKSIGPHIHPTLRLRGGRAGVAGNIAALFHHAFHASVVGPWGGGLEYEGGEVIVIEERR